MALRNSCLAKFCLALAAAAAVGWTSSAVALDDATIEAAKKEGQLTVYTTLIINTMAQPLGDAFQKKYGIKPTFVRTADATELIRRAIDEAKAGVSQCDVIDGTIPAPILRRENLVLKWLPDTAKDLPKDFVDKDGYWAALYAYGNGPAMNTNLVKSGEEPKTWEDLLDPKWKGKMVWSSLTNSGGPGFVGFALREWGQDKGMDYLRKLSEQKIAGIPFSIRVALDQLIAGEYALGPMISLQMATTSAGQGAPVRFLPFNPIIISMIASSICSKAPHPNAAKLFYEFELSEEGQAVFRDNFYLPANSRVPPKDPKLWPDGKSYRAQFFVPDEVEANIGKWQTIYSELFR